MESAGNSSTGRNMLPSPPRKMRVALACVEIVLTALVAYLLAQTLFRILAVDPPLDLPLPTIAPADSGTVDMDRLSSFDPFFRQIGAAPANEQVTVVRESSLRLEVFGLRSLPGGQGTAIIKAQDGQQKLIKVGDRIAPGVTLAAVFPDRLEVNRSGVREAIYLRPQRERRAAPVRAPRRASTALPQSDQELQFDITSVPLSPVRRDRRIVGFRLPDPLPLTLMGSGLEAGDVLTHANGEPLVSFERLEEIGLELSGVRRLSLQIERRGERRNLTISLGGNS